MAFNPGIDGTFKGDVASTFATVEGVTSVDFSKNREPIEITELGDTAKNFILNIKGCEVNFSGSYGGETEQAAIEAAFDATGAYNWEFKPDGSAGFTVAVVITGISYTNATGATPAQWSVKSVATAAWAAV